MKFIRSHMSQPERLYNRGFTLVELMIALAVSGVVIATISTIYIGQQRTTTAQEQVVEMQQNLRSALYIMESEIRMAGFNPRGTLGIGTGFTTANATQLIFGFVADTDNMNNNPPAVNAITDEPDEVETVEYYLYDAYADGDMDLGRRTPTNTQAVAENIEAIQFYYTMFDGTQTLTPFPLANIRAVQISILARAGRPDPDFVNTDNYVTASGAVWGPYNDNRRRRLLVSTVQCRNQGL
jgi:type IV pilus assembly protein PilW